MLETKDLTIRFGGHVAVDHVSCAFQPGTLTAIVGPNGAGKTTYFNLISGQLPASEGRVLLNGQDITALPAPLRTRRGLGRAFQLTQLFPNLSVRENVRLAIQAREAGRGQGGGVGGLDLRQRFQPVHGAVEHLHHHHAEADRTEQLRGRHLPMTYE
jgi:branched-chain amino acid transport system ATP-binding protein